jgi:hypothetical protein
MRHTGSHQFRQAMLTRSLSGGLSRIVLVYLYL